MKHIKFIGWIIISLLILIEILLFRLSSPYDLLYIILPYSVMQIVLYIIYNYVWEQIGEYGGLAIQFTGLSGAGKTTIANAVLAKLKKRGIDIELIDGDEYRTNLCSDLGFSKKDRIQNIKRLAFVAHKLATAGKIAIIAAINPYEESRVHLKQYSSKYITVYIYAPIETVIDRDTKGLYKRALLPKEDPNFIPAFTGISDPFEEPINPDLILDTSKLSLDVCVDKIINLIDIYAN